MILKNYTSSVPIDRTISKIEALLAKAGAAGISKDYQAGRLKALSFQIVTAEAKRISIRLPADGDAVYRVLYGEYSRPRKSTEAKVREQADRTAWKLMQDWVEIQLSLISMQQADFMQVFLPYVWDGKHSFYERLKSNNFLALEAPKSRKEKELEVMP